MDEQICDSFVIRGKDICCNVGYVLHLWIIALMHGAFETEADESIRETLIPATVLNEDLHLSLDLTLDILETEDLLEAEIITREDHGQG